MFEVINTAGIRNFLNFERFAFTSHSRNVPAPWNVVNARTFQDF
jgi:hypothetical protein